MNFDPKDWVGKMFICQETLVIVKITEEMAKPRNYIVVGNGAIDLGDGYYSRRIGKVLEYKLIKEVVCAQ